MDILDLQQEDDRKSDRIESVLTLSQLASITLETQYGIVGPHWGERQSMNEFNKWVINKQTNITEEGTNAMTD